ncbi:uncharacterized protein C1orf105 homolog isoform X3 [Acinonyx jubatus]|uniref:Uncharacterized protein C1orf105 homolog isoform X3 n=1 Tax=Acinonyx jubatus TaxID=32536 RepID=A0ABM3NZR2_ACIJB|nr:uncharacterized protein C1orf105 homolog isoform X3 [Acinonyx jubatus]
MEKRELKVSVPKFDKIPWLSEASRSNKPLVLSLPKRSPHASAFLVSSKKDTHLPILFQVPDVLSKARRDKSNPMLIRSKQLCSTCQEIKMKRKRTARGNGGHKDKALPSVRAAAERGPCPHHVHTDAIQVQPRTLIIPHNLKLSFENLMSHRMMSLPPPKAKTESKHSCNDISTGKIEEVLIDPYSARCLPPPLSKEERNLRIHKPSSTGLRFMRTSKKPSSRYECAQITVTKLKCLCNVEGRPKRVVSYYLNSVSIPGMLSFPLW